MITEEAKTAITDKFKEYKERSDDFYTEMCRLTKGLMPLSLENIQNLEKTLSEIEKNVNISRSILARFRDIEKHIRCLNGYANIKEDGNE